MSGNPAYLFIVRGSTTYEHDLYLAVQSAGVTTAPVGGMENATDVINFIRKAFEDQAGVLDVEITHTYEVSEVLPPPTP